MSLRTDPQGETFILNDEREPQPFRKKRSIVFILALASQCETKKKHVVTRHASLSLQNVYNPSFHSNTDFTFFL